MNSPIGMRCTLRVLSAILVSFQGAAQSGDSGALEFSISPSPVGSGARAAGMYDAFVSIADDATAASWNAAGLVQLERPEISIVGSENLVVDSFHAFMEPGAEGRHSTRSLDLNFLSFSYPFYIRPIERSLTLSLSYQQKYSLDRHSNVQLLDEIEVFDTTIVRNFDFDQEGSLGALTASIGFELTRNLSIGLSSNFWGDTPFGESGWDQTVTANTTTTTADDPPQFTDRVTRDEYDNLSGTNFSIGILWRLSDKWRIGFRYDTAFEADIDYKSTTIGSNVSADPIDEKREIRFPSSVTLGVSYRQSDRLTLSFDMSTTDWSKFTIADEAGVKTSLIDGSSGEERSEFDRTWTFRVGGEYVFVPMRPKETLNTLWTLRGGLLLDQEPASNRTAFDSEEPGDGTPDLFYGMSVGLGLQLYNRINLDFAYQFRYGNNVNSDLIGGLSGFDEDFLQHRFLLSSVVYF